MKQPGGSIINITAPQSYVAMEMQMHVCAAKAGVDMVTRVAAMEWGPLGVRVNSVSPGPIADTEGMNRLAPTEELRAIVTDSVPLKRCGTARDIANCCMWLASPMASYVTGAVIPVDGGWALGGASSSVASMKKALMGG
jgi:NAD(P)-dependent dehydrogenase (short-subunit alcohol dehydrogenase family)